MTHKSVLAAAVGLAVLGLMPGHAAASGLNRAWVSGKGIDQAGCGAPTAPCRSLQYVHDNVVVDGGEIDILDPAGYGAITIDKSISIVNDGVGTAGVQATSGAAITVNAGPTDAVFLKGLNIDGVLRTGSDGIVFNSGGSLSVSDCVIRHFSASGILLAPTSGTSSIFVSLSQISSNGSDGVTWRPASSSTASASLEIEGVALVANGANGLNIDDTSTSGALVVSVAGGDFSSNADSGALIDSSTQVIDLAIDQSDFYKNNIGVLSQGKTFVHLSRSVLDFNATFGAENLSVSPGAFFTTSDNRMSANGTAPSGGTLTAEALH